MCREVAIEIWRICLSFQLECWHLRSFWTAHNTILPNHPFGLQTTSDVTLQLEGQTYSPYLNCLPDTFLIYHSTSLPPGSPTSVSSRTYLHGTYTTNRIFNVGASQCNLSNHYRKTMHLSICKLHGTSPILRWSMIQLHQPDGSNCYLGSPVQAGEGISNDRSHYSHLILICRAFSSKDFCGYHPGSIEG